MGLRMGFHFTILRPQLVVGGSYGVAMNLIPVIGAYAAICREEKRPFSFPGGSSMLFELVDTRLIARLFVWASSASKAKNEIFELYYVHYQRSHGRNVNGEDVECMN